MLAGRLAAAIVLSVFFRAEIAFADAIPTRMPADARPAPPASSGSAPPGYYVASESGPITLPYREDAPFPPGYRLERRTRTAVVVSGAVILAVPYVIGLGATSTKSGDRAMNWLFVPAIGPWMALGLRRSACYGKTDLEGNLCHAGDAFAIMGLIADGIMQTAGATLLIIGLAVPKKVFVRKDVDLSLSLSPAPAGSGLGLRGTF